MAGGEFEYRGLVASAYDLFISEDELGDREFFRQAIERYGQPALEIGCGTGRLLIPFRAAGLEVEGVDSSAEMLALCRRKAEVGGFTVALYPQRMQELDLPRRCRTLYIPAATFMLLSRADEIEQALRGFHHHLEPGGHLLISLFLPWKHDLLGKPPPVGEWRLRHEAIRFEDGATIRCWDRAEMDFSGQLVHERLRYEILQAGRLELTEEHTLTLHWHTQEQFRTLLEAAGFHAIQSYRGHTFVPATEEDAVFTVAARR